MPYPVELSRPHARVTEEDAPVRILAPPRYLRVDSIDANGVAVLNIVYPKSFAQWAQMQLEVTATVGGTEGYNAITIPLPILASDVTNADIAPPNITLVGRCTGIEISRSILPAGS